LRYPWKKPEQKNEQTVLFSRSFFSQGVKNCPSG
jgi:hypothetical protein